MLLLLCTVSPIRTPQGIIGCLRGTDGRLSQYVNTFSQHAASRSDGVEGRREIFRRDSDESKLAHMLRQPLITV